MELLQKRFSFLEIGEFVHPCESDLVLKCTNEMVPYFNAPIYLENKQQIGKVDEIFGPITEFISFSYGIYVGNYQPFGYSICIKCHTFSDDSNSVLFFNLYIPSFSAVK